MNAAVFDRTNRISAPLGGNSEQPELRSGCVALESHKAHQKHALLRRPELLVFICLLIVFNAPVVIGSCWQTLAFYPAAVRDGEWWRVFTHPFVHVTWYHFLLDGSAFIVLYQSLLEPRLVLRLAFVFFGAAASLLVSWACTGLDGGLCGLSGIAHGLMAVSGLELVSRHPPDSAKRRLGLITFVLVDTKAAVEAVTGRMCFSFLEFGLLGQPVAVAHAGGVIGSLLALAFLSNGFRFSWLPGPTLARDRG